MSEDKKTAKAEVEIFEFPAKELAPEHYELLLLVTGNASDEDAAKTFEEVKKLLVAAGGTISLEEAQGRKALAYSVEKTKTANYFLVEFDLLGAALPSFQEKLRIRKDVTRMLIVKKRSLTDEQRTKQEAFAKKREDYRAKKMIENAATVAEAPEVKAPRAAKSVDAAVDSEVTV